MILHQITDLGTGEYDLIGLHHSIKSFIEIINRDNLVSDLMRTYAQPYKEGDSFHSFFRT
tara:strand:- start:193 stop:372 length:180 start_codon:yes stop_codon:yes gene_type:complete